MYRNRKFFVCSVIIYIFFMSGCIAQQELRPQNNVKDIWVCEESNIFFYWDREASDFIGKIFYNGSEKNIVVNMNSGIKMYFFDNESLLDIDKTTEESTLFIASAKYYKDYFILSLDVKDSQIYTNNHSKIKFVKHDKEKYFNGKNIEVKNVEHRNK